MTALERIKFIESQSQFLEYVEKAGYSKPVLDESHRFLLKAFYVMRDLAIESERRNPLNQYCHPLTSDHYIDKEFEVKFEQKMC